MPGQYLPFAAGGGDNAASAGTGDWHVGEGPHHGSVRAAKAHGIDISGQVCRLFRVSDFDTFDRIYVMDKSNLSNILNLARNDEDAKKVKLLLGDKEVPDPYYTNLFEEAYELIERGCKEIIKDYTK